MSEPATSITFDPTDPEILSILGMMIFDTGPISHILRGAGHPIKCRAEDEQAAVLIWLIHQYQSEGTEWREKTDAKLREMQRAAAGPPESS